MLEIARLYLFVFGILTIVGGVVGFVKAKSTASLVAGGISGIGLLVGGYLMSTVSAQVGLIVGTVLSVALAGRFLPAFLKTKKVMPAGLMAGLSVVGVALMLAAFLIR